MTTTTEGAVEQVRGAVEPVTGPVWQTHDRYAADNPDRERTALEAEYARRRNHEAREGSLDSYRPARDFPCSGRFHFVDQAGAVWTAECDVCHDEVGVPKVMVDGNALADFRRGCANLPVGYLEQAFIDTPGTKDARRWLSRWINDFADGAIPCPALVGDTGRGKTHLLALTLDTIIRRYGVDALYVSTTTLLESAQRDIDLPATDRAGLYERACTCEVLALDDLGAERATDWRLDRLAYLVDQRYMKALPILLATNVPKDNWPELVGSRTASRLRGLTLPIEVTGLDWRDRDAA